MSDISVVTVTFNNSSGLETTLRSLVALKHLPREIIIIDGDSTDETPGVIGEFAHYLPLVVRSERDNGIYDAMNKGKALARGRFIHYLNAGDSVFGEPYLHAPLVSRFRVRVLDEAGRFMFEDFVKWGGYGYCHQGILFPTHHTPYQTHLRIAADLDALIATFPHGLGALPLVLGGGVNFVLGGVSTRESGVAEAEAAQVFRNRLPPLKSWRLRSALLIKSAVPRSWRRGLLIAFRSGEADYPERGAHNG